MLNIINRIGTFCYKFCYIAGTMIMVLGFLINFFFPINDAAVYVFYYVFSVVLFIIGFLVKYVFCGKIQ